jgi:hypothetical protein
MRSPRISLLPLAAMLAALALAPAASARLDRPPTQSAVQDLRGPDARDAEAAPHAHLARLHADTKIASARAQQRYYSSYGTPSAIHHPRPAAKDHDSPWLTIGLGLGLTLVVAGAVLVAVRMRRRTGRVRVAV